MATEKIDIELAVCLDEMNSLTKWEQDFIESINEQWSSTKNLSQAQQEKLHMIYNKVA